MISSALITNDLDVPPTYIVTINEWSDTMLQDFVEGFATTCAEHNGHLYLTDEEVEALSVNPLHHLSDTTILGRIDEKGLYLATRPLILSNKSWFCEHPTRLLTFFAGINDNHSDKFFFTVFYKFRKIDL